MAVMTFENDFVRASLNTFGGLMESVVDKRTGLDHAWRYDSGIWPRRTAVCFPFCGKSRNGRYTFGGREYEMPNHGFARERDFKVVSIESGKLVLRDVYDESTLGRYPFKYGLEIEYTLDGPSLVVDYRVSNDGDCTMYYSIGSHYTYQLPLVQEDCAIWFDGPQHAGCLDLSDGKAKADVLAGRSVVSLAGIIDDSSLILDLKDIDSSWIGIGDKSRIFTEASGEGFRYVLIWAPVGGGNPFVCVEFWDGMAQIESYGASLEERFAVRTLESKETRSYRQRITLED